MSTVHTVSAVPAGDPHRQHFALQIESTGHSWIIHVGPGIAAIKAALADHTEGDH